MNLLKILIFPIMKESDYLQLRRANLVLDKLVKYKEHCKQTDYYMALK